MTNHISSEVQYTADNQMKRFKGRNPFSVNIAAQGLDKKSNHPAAGGELSRCLPWRARWASCHVWSSFEVAYPLDEYASPGFCCGDFCEWPFPLAAQELLVLRTWCLHQTTLFPPCSHWTGSLVYLTHQWFNTEWGKPYYEPESS